MGSRADLGRYLATAGLARIATEASGPAILLVTIAIVHDPATGSYLVAGLTGAAAVAGPVVGAMLDRSARPRTGFAVSMALFAVGLVALSLLIGHAPLGLLLGVALVTGLAYPALTGAWTAQLPGLVPASALPRAYSADAGTYSAAAIVGAPLASALLVVSDRAPLWLPAAALLISLAVLRLVPLRPRTAPATHSILGDLRRGIATILQRITLRQAFIITTISFIGQAAIFVCTPLIAQAISGSLAVSGVILGAIAVGGVLGSTLLVRRPVQHPDRAVVVATAIGGIGMLIAGLAHSLPIAVIGAFILGASEAPQMSATFLVRNRESSPEVRAQVFTTAASLRITAFAVGSALFGAMLGLGTVVVMTTGAALHWIAILLGVTFGARSLRGPA